MRELGTGHRQPGQLRGDRLGQPLGGLGPRLGEVGGGGRRPGPASSSTRRARPASASSETSSCASRSRDSRAHSSTPSISAAYLRVSVRSSPCRASLRLQSACVAGQFGEKAAEFGRTRRRCTVSAVVELARPAPAAPRRRWPPAPTWPARPRPRPRPSLERGRRRSAPDSAARAVCAASRSASSSDSRRMSATSASSSPGCGATASISLSPNFSRSASCASSRARCRAVGEIAAGRQPLVAQRAVRASAARSTSANRSSAARCSSGRISRSWSFWPCRVEQLGGERAQRLRGHAAAAEVGPRRPVPADRARGDDAAVVVAVGARGIEDLVDPARSPRRRVRLW